MRGSGFVMYPAHFIPAFSHRKQVGFRSSHLTWRVLQVMQPVRTLGVLTRLWLAANCPPCAPLALGEGDSDILANSCDWTGTAKARYGAMDCCSVTRGPSMFVCSTCSSHQRSAPMTAPCRSILREEHSRAHKTLYIPDRTATTCPAIIFIPLTYPVTLTFWPPTTPGQ